MWIDDLLKMTEEAETPKSFIYWAGLSAIAAVVKREVWLDKHYYKLYPNLYVMLVAPSGHRKSFAISVARKLVEAVGGYRIISGRSSIQAIVKDLSTAYTTPKGDVIADASCFIASSEFASSIVEDPAALTILTDLYDAHAHSEWRNMLKGSGTEVLKDPCVNMISASNQAHLIDKLQEVDIEGGFVGRTIMVVESKKRVINPLVQAPKIRFDLTSLIPQLQQIKTLKGPFTWSKGAADLFEEWYTEHAKKLDKSEISDRTGSQDRIHDHILKIAMLISLSDVPNLILEKQHVEEAIDRCTISASSVERAVEGKGSPQFSRGTRVIITTLLRSPGYEMDRSTLLRKHYHDFDAIDLDRIVQTLEQAGAVKEIKKGQLICYKLTQKFIDEYTKYAGTK